MTRPSAMRAAAALGCLLAAAAPALADGKPSLRPQAMAQGAAVVLGDVFENAGRDSEAKIAPAPPLGGRLLLDAQTLEQLARAHGLDWRPASPQDRALIRRDSAPIRADDIAALALSALAEQGVAVEGVTIDLAPSSRQLQRPAGARIALDGVGLDPSSKRVTAQLAIESDGEPRQTVLVSGRLLRKTAAPVLTRPLRARDVIGPGDVAIAEVPETALGAAAIRDAGALVGMTARRPIAAGKPVQVSDLQLTAAVRRNGLVTLVLATPAMQLTARGRAMADAGVGDRVRVANDVSRAVLEGVVLADGRVAVGGPAALR